MPYWQDKVVIVTGGSAGLGAGVGFLVVYGCGLAQRPFVSNLNVAAVTVANRALVSTEGGRQLCVYTNIATDVVIDVEAWVV